MQQEYVISASDRVPTSWPVDWVNNFGRSVSWDAASPANHLIKEGVVACSFQAKGKDLPLTTYSAHSHSINWFVLEPCSHYYLPFSNGCVICGFNIQTVWILFQFIGKNTKKPTVKNQPCAMPLKIQLINDESPLTIVFVEALLNWLKGLNSSQVGCSGCYCCTIALCFSLVWRASCLFPAALPNCFFLE